MRALALLLLLLASPAFAETVHFPSAATPPTPLQQRLAKERDTPIVPQATIELAGELHRSTSRVSHSSMPSEMAAALRQAFGR